MRKRVKKYRESQDTVAQLLQSGRLRIRTKDEPVFRCKSKDLYSTYTNFMRDNFAGRPTLSSSELTEDLHGRGYESRHTNRGTIWLDLDIDVSFKGND